MIEAKLYRKIIAVMPITCVEFLIIHQNKFLLGKRKNDPAKDKWWFPGGRILKNEKILKALKRKAREEIGLKIDPKELDFIDVKDVFFPRSAFDLPCHNINIIYRINVNSISKLQPDAQHSELKWFSKIDKKWPKYVRDVLKSLEFK